jgi:site-specific recombinase XerD
MALEAVQAQAGHASIESTRIYLHLADDWLASQYRKAAEGHRRPGLRRTPGSCQCWRWAVNAPVRAGHNGMAPLPTWEQLEADAPQVVDTMRRYLQQIGCILRPGSVKNTDLALRAFAGFLVETAPEVLSVAQVARAHIDAYKPWLAARPGQNKARATTATIVHRLGTLRMFFVRIDEWGWDEAPPRVPMFHGDLPRQDHPLAKGLDDAAAAKLLRAAQNDKRLLVCVTVEVLLRTGLRVSELTGLPAADAVVLIGAAPWLHVPVGKLGEDRYLPLHPQLVTLIDEYRNTHVAPKFLVDEPDALKAGKRPKDLLFTGDRGGVLRNGNFRRDVFDHATRAAGLDGLTPHELRHTAASLAVSAGANVKAIQRMLGHASAAMTLDVYAGLFDDDLDGLADRIDEAHVYSACTQETANDPKARRQS